MAETSQPRTDGRIRMYFRIDPDVRDRFRALALLNGETMEGRADRLIREDIRDNLPAAATA